ncbi:MAG: ELWxxDGT repeat protein [Acidobacteriota bacterium]
MANRLIFSGDDGIQGGEPAASDGTPTGTAPLLDVNPGFDTSTPGEMITLGSRALFSAWQGTGDRTLYATDGTSIGTVPLSPLSQPSYLTALSGTAYFSASDTAHGTEVWKSDGTPGGTGLAFDLVPGTPSSFPASFTPLGGKLFFTASDPTAGYELWATDGATANRVADIAPGTASGFPTQLAPSPDDPSGPTIFFAADDGTNGRELWISDGTAAGTYLVRDLAVGPASSIEASPIDSFASESGATMATFPSGLAVFAASDVPGDEEIWTSGGWPVPSNTFRLADVNVGPSGSQPRQLTRVAQRIVFVADDGVHGRELWMATQDNLTAMLLADVLPGPASSVPQHLTGFGGLVLFSADDGTHGREPWVTDGTPEGTRRMADIAPGPLPSSPYNFTAVGGDLYFAATDAVSGFELWRVPRSSLGAHLTATKQVSGQFVAGGLVTYTIVLTNTGLGAQLGNSGVQLEDPISPSLALQSVTASSGTITHAVPGPQINWSGEIPAGGQVTITMIFRVQPGTPPETVITNQATVHFDSDGDLVDDTNISTDDPGQPGGQDGTTFRVGLGLYTVPPCRAFDSRPGSPLLNGFTQTVTIAAVCGIPATAKALSFNLTAIGPNTLGFLRVYPSGSPAGIVSQINFGPGQTRSNNGIIEIGTDGKVVVAAALTFGGAVDFVLDVVGYFE